MQSTHFYHVPTPLPKIELNVIYQITLVVGAAKKTRQADASWVAACNPSRVATTCRSRRGCSRRCVWLPDSSCLPLSLSPSLRLSLGCPCRRARERRPPASVGGHQRSPATPVSQWAKLCHVTCASCSKRHETASPLAPAQRSAPNSKGSGPGVRADTST